MKEYFLLESMCFSHVLKHKHETGSDTFSATAAEEGAGAVPPPVHLAAAKPPRAKRYALNRALLELL